jgi:hypothetical protein
MYMYIYSICIHIYIKIYIHIHKMIGIITEYISIEKTSPLVLLDMPVLSHLLADILGMYMYIHIYIYKYEYVYMYMYTKYIQT